MLKINLPSIAMLLSLLILFSHSAHATTTGGIDTAATQYELPLAVQGIAGIDLVSPAATSVSQIYSTSAFIGVSTSSFPTVLIPGNVGIGTTSPNSALQVYSGTISINNSANHYRSLVYETSGINRWQIAVDNTPESGSNTGSNFYIQAATDTGTWGAIPIYIVRNSGYIGIGTSSPQSTLDVNGIINATEYYHSSDLRLKDSVTRIQNPLNIIKKLHGVSFKWKRTGRPSAGIIAQDVEQVMPSAVRTSKDGTKSVDYDQLIAPMIEAIKLQQREIEDLRSRIDLLKNPNEIR